MASSLLSQTVLAFAILLFLQVALPAQAFLDKASARLMKKPSSSVLSMAWTLPTHVKPSFQPAWYEDCGNPTVRRVVYDDDFYGDDDSYEFSFNNYGSDWHSHDTMESSAPQPEVLPRGARISRAARRAFNGLRNTLRP